MDLTDLKLLLENDNEWQKYNDYSDFYIGEQKGSGSFGKIYSLLKEDLDPFSDNPEDYVESGYVIKVIDIAENFNSTSNISYEELENLAHKECKYAYQLSEKNLDNVYKIVKERYITTKKDENGKERPVFILKMKTAKGDLTDYCNYLREKKQLNEKIVLEISLQILNGIVNIHNFELTGTTYSENPEFLDLDLNKLGCVHRDIKPANIIYNEVNGKNIFYVSDFGTAKKFIHTDSLEENLKVNKGPQTYVGSRGFIPPEELKGQRGDIYSFCKTMFWMLNNFNIPISDKDIQKPIKCSNKLWKIIKKGLDLDKSHYNYSSEIYRELEELSKKGVVVKEEIKESKEIKRHPKKEVKTNSISPIIITSAKILLLSVLIYTLTLTFLDLSIIYKVLISLVPSIIINAVVYKLIANANKPKFEFSVIDGKCNLVKYSGKQKNIIIPREFNGYPLVKIDDYVFRNKNISTVDFPNSIEYIGLQAFADNNITELTLPNNLIKIAGRAFENNDISEINFTDKLTEIGICAFKNNKLKAINLPTSLKLIKSQAFAQNQIDSNNVKREKITVWANDVFD